MGPPGPRERAERAALRFFWLGSEDILPRPVQCGVPHPAGTKGGGCRSPSERVSRVPRPTASRVGRLQLHGVVLGPGVQRLLQ
eukprot:3857173-Alexandrium_andersonii.AAC.1